MLFKKKEYLVEKIYQNIIERSRSKFFYIDYNLEDSFETRFDLIVFHAFIIFYYYKSNKTENTSTPQSLFDHMFGDFENNLREMGFGDIAVNKKMKNFIKAFYGRLSQYSRSIDNIKNTGDKTLLEQTILNNIFKGNLSSSNNVQIFVEYMIKNINNFQNKSEMDNLANNFKFINFN